MAFIIGTTLALMFLDGWVRVAAIAAVASIEIVEILIWLRWRKVKSTTGAEGIVGMTGRVVTDLDPTGQVRIKGQIWKATAAEGVPVGEDVVVKAVDGLELKVARP
jgi:membrane-bound serine protease (ClpP class)